MMETLLKGLLQWLYGLFLDLIAYCSDALLGVMSTDLTFFEQSVPIVPSLYRVMVAIGWGLLIGNCAFQAMKAMFAGLGLETESPAILLLRTLLFGVLLIFSGDVCAIGLSIGKNVIALIGIPEDATLTFPTEGFFADTGAAWLLVILIGFVLGFQIIKLFFEIAERYVLVGILTLLFPLGMAMGGSKSTKDICTGYVRTYGSMIVMMVLNVLFLKLILSALSAMPTGTLVLPWCLLVVGLAKCARKADNLISKIGLNPAITGDPLGHGRGGMVATMAARTVLRSAIGKSGGNHSSQRSNNRQTSANHHTSGGNTNNSTNSFRTASSAPQRTTQSTTQTGTAHTDMNGQGNHVRVNAGSSGSVHFNSNADQRTRVNTDRFGAQAKASGTSRRSYSTAPSGFSSQNTVGQASTAGNITPMPSTVQTNVVQNTMYPPKATSVGGFQQAVGGVKPSGGAAVKEQKSRFGSVNTAIKHNENPLKPQAATRTPTPPIFGKKPSANFGVGSSTGNTDGEETNDES